MNPAISNLLISLGTMQIARKIDFDDPQIFLAVRCSYVFSQLLCFAAYYYVSLSVKRKNDTTVLKYVEPKAPMQQDPGAMVTTTNKDYDLSETTKAVRSQLIGLAIMCFMHFYLKYTQPLFIQSILPLKSLYESQVIQLHIFGKAATGKLKRPFAAAPSPFGGATATPAAEEDEVVVGEKAKITEIETKKDK